jgi:hypothetical protein
MIGLLNDIVRNKFKRFFVASEGIPITSGTSYHGVKSLVYPQYVTRKSFAAYYSTKEAPVGWTGEKHSTLFKARPDEWTKGNILMPYEKISRGVRSGINALKLKLK